MFQSSSSSGGKYNQNALILTMAMLVYKVFFFSNLWYSFNYICLRYLPISKFFWGTEFQRSIFKTKTDFKNSFFAKTAKKLLEKLNCHQLSKFQLNTFKTLTFQSDAFLVHHDLVAHRLPQTLIGDENRGRCDDEDRQDLEAMPRLLQAYGDLITFYFGIPWVPVFNRKYIDSFMVDFPASHVTFRGDNIGWLPSLKLYNSSPLKIGVFPQRKQSYEPKTHFQGRAVSFRSYVVWAGPLRDSGKCRILRSGSWANRTFLPL